MFKLLVSYCEKKHELTGKLVSSISESQIVRGLDGIEEIRLGRWVHTQNKLRRLGKLRYDRLLMFHELIESGVYSWPIPKTNRI